MLKPATLLKLTLPRGSFSRFIKLYKLYHIARRISSVSLSISHQTFILAFYQIYVLSQEDRSRSSVFLVNKLTKLCQRPHYSILNLSSYLIKFNNVHIKCNPLNVSVALIYWLVSMWLAFNGLKQFSNFVRT